MPHENIDQIVERAKQARAEYIGSAIRNHPIATLAVAGIPVLLSQLPWGQVALVAQGVERLAASLA